MPKGPAKIETEQFEAVLTDLAAAFDTHPESVLKNHHNRQAMVRGEKEDYIQTPRFVIASIGTHLTVKALTRRGVPQGRYSEGQEDFEPYPDTISFNIRGQDRNLEPLDSLGRSFRNYGDSHFLPAVECAKILLPTALEAEPLSIDRQIAQVMIDHGENLLYL